MPPAGSTSLFMKYGPAAQSIPSSLLPVLPTVSVNSPLALVVTVCLSSYTAVPFSDPCSIDSLTPTSLLLTSLPVASRTTAW